MPRRAWIALAAAGACAAAVAVVAMVSCHPPATERATPTGNTRAMPIVDGGAIASDGATASGATAPSTAPSVPARPRPARVKIVIHSVPNKAKVSWGRKLLGETPLTFDRPRDSGPLDLTVRSDGYFPIHARVYTYKNDVLYLKMTKLADRMTLFGAKKELPPETPDGGAPPQPPLAPPAPTAVPSKG